MSVYKKPIARDLLCVFATLVEAYSEVGLRSCEVKEPQMWRHVSTQETAMQLALSVKKSRSITELNNQIVRMQQHLEDQSTEIEN